LWVMKLDFLDKAIEDGWDYGFVEEVDLVFI
jgi:hypothetical protein